MPDDQPTQIPSKTLANSETHESEVPSDLVDHLCRSSRITEQEATRLISEVLAYYSETSDEFMRQRHKELQKLGYNNADIFSNLQHELAQRRFKAKPLSSRQIRRAIYG